MRVFSFCYIILKKGGKSMGREKRFSFFSFLLTIITIGLLVVVIGGSIYLYMYMSQNEISIKDSVDDVKVSIKKAVEIVTNPSTSNPNVSLSADNIENLEVKQVREEETEANYYFYNQLTDNGKLIYNMIEKNLDNMKTGIYTIDFGTRFNETLQTEKGKQELKVDFQAAWDALALDNPMVFFIDVTKLYLTIESTTFGDKTVCSAYIGPENNISYLISGIKSEDIDKYEQKLEAIKNNVATKVEGSEYDKLKQIHDVLVDELEYDQTLSRIHTHDIYGALVERCVVCEGYAKAYKYLLDGIGIPCVLVSGKGTNSKGETEEHIWNYVFLKNRWYAVDVTWDDPIITGGILTNSMKYKYFLRGSDMFNQNHMANN